MGDGLGAIQHHRHAVGMGHADYLLDGQDSPKGVGDMGDGNELCAGGKHLLVLVHQELAGLVDGNDAKDDTLFLAEHLPGNDIGVVFHVGNDNFVAWPETLFPERLGDYVYAVGGTASEDDLVVIGGVEQALHLGAGTFVVLSGVLAEGVDTTVDVGVFGGVVAHQLVDYRLGLLGGGAVVEVDQRLAIDLLLQDREVRPNFFRIETGGHLNYLLNLPACTQMKATGRFLTAMDRSKRDSRWLRRFSGLTLSTISLAKARTSIRLAVGRSRPRLRR